MDQKLHGKRQKEGCIFNGSFKGILNVLHKMNEHWNVTDGLEML